MEEIGIKKRKLIKTSKLTVHDSQSHKGFKYLYLYDANNLHHVSFWRHRIQIQSNEDGIELSFHDEGTNVVYEIEFDDTYQKWYIRNSDIDYYYYLDYNPTDVIQLPQMRYGAFQVFEPKYSRKR